MTVPRLPLRLLRAWLPYAERDEVIAELSAEYSAREAREGHPAARAWLWRQVLDSVPPLARRTFSRGWTGFEPASSRLRPGGPPMESFIMDLRYAARRLLKRPSYALLAILTLAIGVGGTAAAFGLVRGLLMTPLPYPAEERLGLFWQPGDWSEREYLHLSSDQAGFSGVAAFRTKELPLRRGPQASPELVTAVTTTATLFDVLGVRPVLGRAFEANEDRPGAAPAVVLSDGLYAELGGQPSLVGSTVELDGATHTVVGVMPKGFWFPDPTVRAWVAEPFNEEDGSGNYALVARRAPGTDGPALDLALTRLGARLKERFQYPPAWDKSRRPALTPLREHLLGPLQAPLLATLAAMAVLLLIACANVAALMLGQVDSRATELAVRMALGADSRRMTQQLLAEALLLGLAAASLGAVIAAQGFRLLTEALPLGPLAPRGSLDWGVFSAALVLALASAFLVALLPARSLRRSDPQRALSKSRTGGIGARGGRTEGALVVGQVALAVLLADLEATLSTLPGVRAVGITQKLPLRGQGEGWGLGIEGKPDLPRSTTYVRLVSPGYFEAIGPARQVMSVLTFLTALAVMLGAVGVHGVTSHFVRRRQRDLGICIALGGPAVARRLHAGAAGGGRHRRAAARLACQSTGPRRRVPRELESARFPPVVSRGVLRAAPIQHDI